MTVLWSVQAKRDRSTQVSYVGERNPRAAISIGDALMAASAGLDEFPGRGREGRVAGTRELVVPRLPYILVYRVAADRIIILRILHGARRWPPRQAS